MKRIIFLLLFFSFLDVFSQVKGQILDAKNEPLSFVSVYLNGTVTGTTSNYSGNYVLDIKKKGTYTLVYQYLGYKTLKKKVVISEFPYVLDIILEEENVQLAEISISTKDNPANKIIRNAIANKDKNTDKFAAYTANFYSRGLYKIKDAPEKFMGQNMGDFGGGLDSTRSGIIYLSETISEIKYQKKPKQFKENIIASKVSGTDNGISFNRAEDANINFYENAVEFGNNLVSPIANSAFSYYTFKLVGTFYDKNGKLINKIQMIPKRKNDRVFGGFIYIIEDEWALYGVDVTVTGAQINIPVVDVLKLKQDYNYSEENDAWVLISQSIDFKVNFFGFKFDGRFSSAYSKYTFNPEYTDQTFTNEVLTFEQQATEKDSVYWNQLRPVPLTQEEVKDYQIKDSIKAVRKSKKYLDSVNKIQNKFNLLSPVTGYTYRNSFEKWSLSFDGLIDDLSYNTVQGFNTSLGVSYFKRQNDFGKWWNVGAKVNYGLSDKRARPTLFFSKKWNNISRPRITLSMGVITPQFNEREPIIKLTNTLHSLLYKNNFMKIYEKEFVKFSYAEEVKNGVFLNTSIEIANRNPLFNTSDYTFFRHENKEFGSNNPLDTKDYENAAFTQHRIASLKIGARFVFGQKYLSYPNSKFNIGNAKYPIVNLQYRKMFGASNNELNSDAFIGRVTQNINMGNSGVFVYNIRGGIFLKKKDIAFMDYFQPNGNQLLFPLDVEHTNSFGLLNFYDLYSNDRYSEMHVQHSFKGALLSKVPLINKLNFHLIAGAKSLFIADKKPYTEYSLGLENIGWGKWRILRVDYVRSNYGNIQKSGWLFGISLFK